MQAYGAAFARIYDLMWAWFARDVAPRIFDFYARTRLASTEQSLLETGWYSAYFARAADLGAPLDQPEREGRVFIVAAR